MAKSSAQKHTVKGNNHHSQSIGIEHVQCKGADGVDRPKLPPEGLLRIRESLAVGIAKTFISKALQDIQTESGCEATA